MRQKIIENIARLSLHDSHIEKIGRTQDKLVLNVDWAKLDNHIEKSVEESIILGKCELIFDGFNNEHLRVDFTGSQGNEDIEPIEIAFDIQLLNEWLILENKLDTKNRYCLSGFVEYEGKCGWVDWSFSFLEFKFSWNNSVTLTDWKNGKHVEEK